MKEYIDFNDLVNELLVDELHIETKRISDFCKCSVRLVQKWCKNNNIKYHRIKGIKHYLLDWNTVDDFGEWYNRNYDKPKKSYYVPKPRKNTKPKIKNVINFITIKDIFYELIPYDVYKKLGNKKLYRTSTRYIQEWCKNKNISLVNFSGRKYYKITESIKSEIMKEFKYLRQFDKYLNN